MNFEMILTSFSLGLLSAGSPCVFPLYPGFLAYLSGGQQTQPSSRTRYLLGFFVLAGVLVMMLALGGVIALLSVSVSRALAVIVPLADALILLLGILLLLDINPFKRLPQVRVPVVSHPFVNAFLYGLLYGPIALPCSGPLVVGIFAYSFTVQQTADQLMVFLWFGLGFGLPLLLLSLLAGATQRWVTRSYARHSRAINIAAGLLLVALAVYDLYANREFITSLLPPA